MSNEAPTPGRVVVTGSSSGIGRAIAAHLLELGWQVLGLDLAPATLHHPAFTAQQADLGDATALAALAERLAAPDSAPVDAPVDALVHAAGVLRVGPLGQLVSADGALMWRLHVDAATTLANALVPAMAARCRGRVVFIGSRVAQGMPGRSQYAATKAALVALTRSWAAEVAAQQVTLNVISPAATQTAMLSDPARTQATPRLPPLGRLIQPEEIAALTAFLLSPQAAAITGQDIAICGGASLNR